ncbi:MAG: HEAT repeat domain-containing protein [Paludisphaera borealis]|uniref:HEAT repeat domain-containing protein n=1 Tax=Paludisphaera borealis TaxID=1387353 RepID=UPI00284E0E4C|nr:HEAT repeat domain-containing protein [Paludisphaera borealis]MDR3622254.1 HEAT repeat domain-containing protein [Paludisphaera borealis]
MSRASLRRAALGCLMGALGLGTVGPVATARADVIVLRGGGQVEGKVVPAPVSAQSKSKSKENRVEVLLLKSKTPLMLRKEQILEIVPKASPLDEYLVKREKAAATAPAQFELGQWCESNKLGDLARVHYEAALEHDKTLVAAHQKLGHVEHAGQWLSRDELRKVQGLTKHKGRWITEDEKTKQDEQALTTAGQASWVRRIKLMVQGVLSGAPDRRREAETQFMQIRDPEAVWPLVKVMGGAETDIRILLAQTLGEIPGKESAQALVRLILAEEEDVVRGVVLDRLKKSDDPGILPQLVRALGSNDLRVVNRAAWTLGNLDAVGAVPRLLNVLVTSEERLVLVPPPTGGQGPGFPPILMAWNGNSAAYMIPPAVGAGSVAFGATVVPGVFALDPYNPGVPLGPTLGGGDYPGSMGGNRGPTPRLMTFTYQNVEVLGALVKLTEQDFGYDVDQWRQWVARSFNPRPNPVRRVPQP